MKFKIHNFFVLFFFVYSISFYGQSGPEAPPPPPAGGPAPPPVVPINEYECCLFILGLFFGLCYLKKVRLKVRSFK